MGVQLDSLIETIRLKKYFTTAKGTLHAVDDISLQIRRGETLGIVGESGCGKSTLGRVMIHLLESTGGKIFFEGKDITHVNKRELHEINENMQIIFQDPYSSLNPRQTIEETVMEPLQISGRYKNKHELIERTKDLMALVGIDKRLRMAYPHELDGGRRQRVGIARALSLEPRFIVCDEPVSALDVSIQSQILNLLQDLQDQHGLTYMFITHDLSVVRHISDHICVMYLGQIVEKSPARDLFKQALHPYSKALISAIPSIDIRNRKERIHLKGEITSPINPKPGCRFMSRCIYAKDSCAEDQVLCEILPNHFVACSRAVEINS